MTYRLSDDVAGGLTDLTLIETASRELLTARCRRPHP